MKDDPKQIIKIPLANCISRDAVPAWRYAAASGLLLTVLLLLACRPAPTPVPAVHFRIGTADATQYIAREVADAYRRAHPTTTFDFFTSNSTTALRQMPFEHYDMTFIERNPRADELENAHATALELGRDGVYVIVHPSNPLTNLSREDLRKVLTGAINQWSQLNATPPNGRDEIQVLAREDGSGMRAVIEEKVLQGGRITPTALLMPTNLDMIDYVAGHTNAIGYLAGNIWNEASNTRPLAIDGIPALPEHIRDGSYPLVQTVFLVVPKSPGANLNDFLEYLASNDGRSVLYRRITELPPK